MTAVSLQRLRKIGLRPLNPRPTFLPLPRCSRGGRGAAQHAGETACWAKPAAPAVEASGQFPHLRVELNRHRDPSALIVSTLYTPSKQNNPPRLAVVKQRCSDRFMS